MDVGDLPRRISQRASCQIKNFYLPKAAIRIPSPGERVRVRALCLYGEIKLKFSVSGNLFTKLKCVRWFRDFRSDDTYSRNRYMYLLLKYRNTQNAATQDVHSDGYSAHIYTLPPVTVEIDRYQLDISVVVERGKAVFWFDYSTAFGHDLADSNQRSKCTKPNTIQVILKEYFRYYR